METYINSLKSFFSDRKEDQELEFRFGTGNSKYNINLQNYIDLQACLYSQPFSKVSVEFSNIITYANKIRVTQIMDYPSEGNILSYSWKNNKIIGEKIVLKENIKNIDYNDYNLRFSVSRETTTDISKIKDVPVVYFRIRKRVTFYCESYKIDLSILKESDSINTIESKDFTYNVEVEMIDYNFNLELLLRVISNNICVIQQSYNVLSNQEIKYVIEKYMTMVKTNKFIGNKPENIKSLNLKEQYSLTLKYNGERRFLFILDKKCYTINNNLKVSSLNTIIDNLDYTLIDGEFLNGNYYAFDILFYKKKDVRDLIFSKRLKMLKTCSENTFIIVKEYLTGDPYKNMLSLLAQSNEYTDGIIVVTSNSPYNKKQLKYKPINTIDFKIKKISNDKDHETWWLYCSGDTLFHYEGVEKHIVTLPKNLAMHYLSGTVVEFYYENDCFIPMKTRYDKREGNYITIAQDIYSDIINPFDVESLNNLMNMRRYHNWIKRTLLYRYTSTNTNKSLLDLACGKGGDIQKWVDNNIKYVEGYDVSQDSINNANSRFSKILTNPSSKNFDFKFTVLDLSKEQVKSHKEKFGTMTCFFAIHYFYKQEEYLMNLLANTSKLQDDGYFIMTVLDKTELKKINYTFDNDYISITKKKIDEKKLFNNTISVYIRDSVLDTETDEYLVDYEYTIKLFEKYGLFLIETKLFSEYYDDWKKYKNTLSINEQKYSFLNRMFVFQKRTKVETKMNEMTIQTDFNKMTLNQLRQYCKNNRLPVSGNKKNLIEVINKAL